MSATTTPRAVTMTDTQIEIVLDALEHLKGAKARALADHLQASEAEGMPPIFTPLDLGVPQIDTLIELFGDSDRVTVEPML